MSNKKAVLKLRDGSSVTLDGYSVDDVRWIVKAMAQPAPAPAPQPEANPLVEPQRPHRAVPAKAAKPKLPTLRAGDYLEAQPDGSYFKVEMPNGKKKIVPRQIKGLFKCAYCEAVVTSPAARGGHESAHIKRGEQPIREVVEMGAAERAGAVGLSDAQNAV